MMRITVDIEAKQLAAIQKATGIRKKSPAVRQAMDVYVKDLEKKRFLRRVLEGHCDYGSTNAQLESRGTYDAD